MNEFDLVIIGAGTSGIAAAVRAVELNAHVCLIEKDKLGGRNLHSGLYPYRNLMHQMKIHGVNGRLSDAKGEGSSNTARDRSDLFEAAGRFSEAMAGKRKTDLTESGVHIETGEGFQVGPNEIRVDSPGQEKIIRAQNIILATGSDRVAPVTIPYDGERIIASDQVLAVGKVPDSVLISGGGELGCELAVLYNRLGSKTFLSDPAPRLLPDQDPDIIEAMEGEMKRQKIKLLLNKKIISIFKDSQNIDISLDGGVKFSVATMVLVSSRKPRTEKLEAEKLGLRLGEKSQILVDETQATTLGGVYAVGSVTGRISENGLSEEEGRVAAENALGKKARLNRDWIPRIVYTHPEIATVGCHAVDAHHKGFRGVEGRCNYDQLDHSLIGFDDSGFVKIVADKTSKKVIGGQIVADRASEFIPLILLAIKKGLPVSSLARLCCGTSARIQGIREAAKACVQALRV